MRSDKTLTPEEIKAKLEKAESGKTEQEVQKMYEQKGSDLLSAFLAGDRQAPQKKE